MTTRQDVEPVFQKALDLIEEREATYGDSWKQEGGNLCIREAVRKAKYINHQFERKKSNTPKFMGDLLDLMAWASFCYWHLDQENKETK